MKKKLFNELYLTSVYYKWDIIFNIDYVIKNLDMKNLPFITSLALACISITTYANSLSNIAVYSTEKSTGSITIGNNAIYTKTFEVSLANLTSENVNLSNFCLKAYSPDLKVFKLDTVDESLTSGSLSRQKPVKGIAMFSSDSNAVYNAHLIKISNNCK